VSIVRISFTIGVCWPPDRIRLLSCDVDIGLLMSRQGYMMRSTPITVLTGLAFAWCCVNTARSEPLRIALVIANGRYASMPALTRCTASAATVRDALRGLGFEVMERSDLGRGEFDTSVGALARRLAATPGAAGVLYYCGYDMEFNGRSFLLPVSASITRDYDVLTQGIIAKSLVDSLVRGKESTGLVLLDVFRTPAASSSAGLSGLAEQIHPSNFAVIGASNDGSSEGPTAASLAVRDQTAEAETAPDRFAAGIHRRLTKAPAVTAHFIPAIASPSPAPAASTASPAVAVPPAPPPAAPPTPEAAVVASPAAPPRVTMADEDQMPEQDRRRVQVLLASMGYYSGRIDGTFGPETRAAIRRYQFEIKAEMTGRLNAEQATRLVNSTR
jgi:Putative peptidoglycan binding domain/Caspase domain